MTGFGERLGPRYVSAKTYDLPATEQSLTFEVPSGAPVAFHVPPEVSTVALELEGPGKVVVPSRKRERLETYAVQAAIELDLGDEDGVVGLELDGPGTVRVRTVIAPPAARG